MRALFYWIAMYHYGKSKLQLLGSRQWYKHKYLILFVLTKIKGHYLPLIILRKWMVNVSVEDHLDTINDWLNNSISFWKTQGHTLEARFFRLRIKNKSSLQVIEHLFLIFTFWLFIYDRPLPFSFIFLFSMAPAFSALLGT